MAEDTAASPDFTEHAAEIVGAYVAHNSVPVTELPNLLRTVHDTLVSLGKPEPVEASAEPPKPRAFPWRMMGGSPAAFRAAASALHRSTCFAAMIWVEMMNRIGSKAMIVPQPIHFVWRWMNADTMSHRAARE